MDLVVPHLILRVTEEAGMLLLVRRLVHHPAALAHAMSRVLMVQRRKEGEELGL